MKWNWQDKLWPRFKYDSAALEKLEAAFLRQSGEFSGAIKHVTENDKQELIVEIVSEEAFKTSEIEGELLNRESVQSSIRRNFGIQIEAPNAPPAERGIAEMMVDLYRTFDETLSERQLFAWHKMLMKGRKAVRDVGSYRTHAEPMQVVSGSFEKPKVHFEAPPSSAVPHEMREFVIWFNSSREECSPLLRAGIAHLYFVSIHPFEDGNGRVARALAEKTLSQALRQPVLIALSRTIQEHRKDYYDALERNNKGLEITDWLEYFAGTILEAQKSAQGLLDFVIEKKKFYDRLQGKLNDRQKKVLERMFREGPDRFKGGMSAENYIKITGTSRATATRDLQDLVENGAFVRKGDRRYARYYLAISSFTG